MKVRILLFLFLLATIISYAQDEKSKKLSLFVDRVLAAAPPVPGVSIVVVNTDSIVFAKGFGWADVENSVKATAETGFYIASTTKPFVAFLAATLADKGKIDLQRPISDYAPFKNFSDKSLFKNITIHDLLTHQSGGDNDFLSIKLAYSGDYDQKMILDLVEKHTVANEKGRAFEYTNFGYYLFSILLKEELGLDWRDLLRDMIFEPLDMKNTTSYISVAERKDLAMPYNGILSDTPQRAYLMKTDDTMHAAGGIISSANDMGKWLMFQMNMGKVGNTQLYSREVLQMTQLQKIANMHKFSPVFEGNGYALGWRTGTYKDTPLIYHFGGYTGFFAHLSFLPEKKLAVAVFVNHELGSVPGNLIAEYAYDLYLGNTSALKGHEKYADVTLPKLVEKNRNAEIKSRAHFAKRAWQLTLPKSSYAGSYFNPELGTVLVKSENDELTLTFGNMKSIATAIELPDVIRVELIPGDGMAIRFVLKDHQVQELRYNGISFIKKQ
ncbi:MAG: serine hydrolase [Cyclobacteriaceae bacterium]|nr:serine hydrolase [Cyclobacteriaceae bacterium]